MNKWLPFSVFIVVYLVSLLATLPASFVVDKLTLPSNISLSKVEGTIWQSHISQVSINDIMINRVNINVSPLSLLVFNPTLSVTFGDALLSGPEGKLNISHLTSDIRVKDLELFVAANEVSKRLPLPIPVSAKNTIALTIEEFQLGQPVCQTMQGEVTWQKAAFKAMDESVDLGSLSAELSCQKGELIATLNENNQLGVTFSAQLGANHQLKGQGYLTPSDNLPTAISQILPFLGRPDSQGRYRLAL